MDPIKKFEGESKMKLRHQSTVMRVAAVSAALFMATLFSAGCSGVSDEPMASTSEAVAGSISISGAIFDAKGNPLSGVTVHLGGGAQSTVTTGASGTYAFNGLAAGSYSVQPSLSGCSFVPSAVNLNGLTASTVVNFDGSGSACGGESQNSGATSGALTISGRVIDAAGNPVRGIRILLNGNTQAVRTTTSTGTYAFQVNPGSYSLTPTGSCAFTPDVVNLNSLSASRSQDFRAGAGCAGTAVDGGAPDAKEASAPDAKEASAPDAKEASAPDATEASAPDTSTSDAKEAGPPDVCVPATCAAAGRVCGSLSNGCGGTLQCGTCAANQTCNAAGQCVNNCVPTTCAAASRVCGPLSDGCGATLQCGTCAANQTCSAAGQCVSNCVPTTCAAAGKVCGSLSDGCGTTLNCGTCPSGTACSTDGTTCNPVAGGCDTNSTTTACLQSRPAGCFQCAVDNGCLDPAQIGGTCEQLTGTAPATCQSVLATSTVPTETQVCMKTLHDIFASGCAADGQETPCLCGATDAQACLGGSVTPLGAVYPVYQCDLGPAIADIKTNFNDLTRGGGMGNTIIQCAASLGCPCF
jgi:hypothetical protein